MVRGHKIRMNGDITAPKVSVICADGTALGEMPTAEALLLARGQRLDLVEVNPVADPPVCKILDFHKLRYEAAKARVRDGRHEPELEIRDNQIKEKE
jgi:translation initiation factor IF-3